MITAERKDEVAHEAVTLVKAVLDVGGRWKEATEVLRTRYDLDLIRSAQLAQRCLRDLARANHRAATETVLRIKENGAWRIAD